MADTINELSTHSVQELISTHSIQELSSIKSEYDSQLKIATTNLNNLISTKFRQLIKISDNITNIDNVGKRINTDLQDLSYNSSKFKKFNDNKFETKMRESTVKSTQVANKKTILINLLSSLTKFDKNFLVLPPGCKLTPGEKTAAARPVNGADLKILDFIRSKNGSNGNGLADRSNEFIDFSKMNGDENFGGNGRKLSSILSSLSASISSSSLSPSSLYHLSLIYFTIDTKFSDILSQNTHLNNTYTLLKEKFDTYLQYKISSFSLNREFIIEDLYSETFDIDDDEYFNYSSNFSSSVSSPIENIFLAYSILNHYNSLSTRNDFLKLRYKYLKSMYSNIDVSKIINFLPLIKLLQNTCDYINLNVKNITWKACLVIGYKDWINDDLVVFNQDDSRKLLDTSMLDLVLFTFDFILSLTKNNKSDICYPITLFSRFVLDLKKFEDHLDSNDLLFTLMKFLDSSEFLKLFLANTVNVVYENFKEFCDEQFQNCLDLLESTPPSLSLELFSDNLLASMEKNTSNYINSIANYTTKDEVSNFVTKWFVDFNKFNENQLKTGLNNPITKLSKQEISWSTFETEIVTNAFQKLSFSTDKLFWESIHGFVAKIAKKLDLKLSIPIVYTLLGSLIAVKEGVNEGNTELVTLIDSSIKTCFENIVQAAPISIGDEYFKNLSKANADDKDIPNSPTMFMTRRLLKVSRAYLSAGEYSNDFHHGDKFINKNSVPIFEQIKAKHFEKVSNDLLIQGSEYLKSNKVQFKLVLADLIFLLHFTTKKKITSNHNLITKLVEEVNSEQVLIDSTTTNIIIKNIGDFYNASKDIYSPLLN